MTEQVQKEKQITIAEAVDAAKDRFIQIAPRFLDYNAERAFAVQLLDNNEYLKRAAFESPRSLEAAIINVAAIGLSLNPAKKQAYLIPRNVKTKINNKDVWVTKIFLEPSYIGLADLATMTGSVRWVQAQIVRNNDTYVDNGVGVKPTHTYEAFAPAEKRGAIVGAYCIAKTADGDFLTTVMTLEELNGIRDRSESWKRKVEKEKKGEFASGGPWETDFAEQCKKTTIRRGYKTWPKTESDDRLALAVQLSNENEGFEPILTSPELGQYTAEQKGYFDQLIQKSDAIEMLLFTKSIDESVFTNLYHSFTAGQKGKYQGIVDSLCRQGHEKLAAIAQAVDGHASRNDDAAIAEELLGLSPAALAWVSGAVSNETAEIMRTVQRESAP